VLTSPAETLGIDPERARAAVAFFEWSAAEIRIEPVASPDERRPTGDWEGLATTASALRAAAQWSLLLDQRLGTTKLEAAARAYVRLGLPYGYFLGAIADESNEDLLYEAGSVWLRRDRAGVGPLMASAIRRPVQQTYLRLALTRNLKIARHFSRVLEELDRVIGAHSTTPIGALGLPVSTYVQFADAIGKLREREDDGSVAVDLLSTYAERHGESLLQARQNTYLWEGLLSPVEVVDVDLIGFLVAAAAAFRDVGRPFGPSIITRRRELLPLARVNLDIAFAMMSVSSHDQGELFADDDRPERDEPEEPQAR
jgi:hypothetical protein